MSTPKKYIKRPIPVEAVQYPCKHPALSRCNCDQQANAACAMCGFEYIETDNGRVVVNLSDWIITGVQGEHYPCPASVFAQSYVVAPDGDGGVPASSLSIGAEFRVTKGAGHTFMLVGTGCLGIDFDAVDVDRRFELRIPRSQIVYPVDAA